MRPWRTEDKAEVKAMIENTLNIQAVILQNGSLKTGMELPNLFVKVMPKDYKAVLQKQKIRHQATVNDADWYPEPLK